MKKNKQIVVIYEGPDKSGKTSLRDAVNKATSFKYWCLDRSMISSIVYDKLFNRNHDNYNISLFNSFNDVFDVIIIYCKCPIELINKRLIIHHEKMPNELLDINNVYSIFEQTFNKLKIKNILEVDTSSTITSCVNKVIKFIESKGGNLYE